MLCGRSPSRTAMTPGATSNPPACLSLSSDEEGQGSAAEENAEEEDEEQKLEQKLAELKAEELAALKRSVAFQCVGKEIVGMTC